MIEHMDRYKTINSEIVYSSEVRVLVEGETNAQFYKTIPVLKQSKVRVENGYSCSDIITAVKNHSRHIGIIDRDYNHRSVNNLRVFPIDYYSIENFVLLTHTSFSHLRKRIYGFYNDHSSSQRIVKQKLHGHYVRNPHRVEGEFELTLRDSIDFQYHSYLSNTIKCCSSYTKYSPLKSVVESYINYCKEHPTHTTTIDVDKKVLKNYITTLSDNLDLDISSPEDIFEDSVYAELDKTIRVFKNTILSNP